MPAPSTGFRELGTAVRYSYGPQARLSPSLIGPARVAASDTSVQTSVVIANCDCHDRSKFLGSIGVPHLVVNIKWLSCQVSAATISSLARRVAILTGRGQKLAGFFARPAAG